MAKINSILTKRRARYVGEMGFFADNSMAGDDLALATEDEEVLCIWYSPKTLKALKRLWGIVDKTAQNTDRWLHKREAMDELLVRVGFSKLVWDSRERKLVLRPKSLAGASNEELKLITGNVTNVICTEVIPGMAHNALRREVEEMLKPRS